VVDLIRVDLMRLTLIDHAPRKDMIRNPKSTIRNQNMPGFLLHQGASICCAHGGQAQATAPNPRVRVGGQPVVTQPVPHLVAGCPFTTPGGPMPCVTAQWVTGALRVLVGGVPVLLQDSQAVCIPNGTPVTVVMTQVRVKGQ
jgi:uncharacterized Zn-binding protein involved in type VI secretion